MTCSWHYVDYMTGVYWQIYKTISAAKVQMYEQHKEDLRVLKYFMHKYLPGKYNEVFRKAKADNYVAYTGHMDKETASQLKKKANVEDFSRYIQKLVRSINPEEKDHIKICANVLS